MAHRIEFSPAAARQLRKLDARARRRVQAVVELLAQEPRPASAKKPVGGSGSARASRISLDTAHG